ncbi:glycosyltransferase family 2 protein [Polaribacter sp. Q13]|uniref:glycosyltransferase family 2 protein n=1 Tax=Polaribacter sp. Q13 TaxID=2806551 RepID=UPI00193C73A2|nr:glycosyltransferase family 2 protein [Polaribacter sp. Q13]QVY65500.1 glycosyltransferase family 2 protein [Polaribacter sp. Q13]
MTKITAIIPTLNEEIHIGDAIKSVSFADEIIVIDSYSTDKTLEIAEMLNVKIIKRKFDDFSSQKNFAIDQATHAWIYILDADERVTPALEKEILDVVKNPKDFVGYNIRRITYFAGKNIKYGGVQNDRVIRLFLKDFCKYDGALVHEKINFKGKIGVLKENIEHYTFRDYNHYINKLNRYSTLKSEELFSKGKSTVSLFHFIIKPSARFIKHYFIKLGFLDGYAGLIFAKTQSYGVLSRYIKLWLLTKKS